MNIKKVVLISFVALILLTGCMPKAGNTYVAKKNIGLFIRQSGTGYYINTGCDIEKGELFKVVKTVKTNSEKTIYKVEGVIDPFSCNQHKNLFIDPYIGTFSKYSK